MYRQNGRKRRLNETISCIYLFFFPPHLIQFRPDDVNAIKFYSDVCKYLRAFYRETCRKKFFRETHDGSRPKTLQVFKLFYDDDRGGAGQSYGGPPWAFALSGRA